MACSTLVTPWSLAGSFVQWDFPGKNTRVPFPPPRDLPDPWIKPKSPALAVRFFTNETPGKTHFENTGLIQIPTKGQQSGQQSHIEQLHLVGILLRSTVPCDRGDLRKNWFIKSYSFMFIVCYQYKECICFCSSKSTFLVLNSVLPQPLETIRETFHFFTLIHHTAWGQYQNLNTDS